MPKPRSIPMRALACATLSVALFVFAGASDPSTRFTQIGHQLMCICGCGQILLECNHVGCPSSDGMRNELMAEVMRGDSDSLVEQSFVQKYGATVLAAPTTSGFDRAAWIMPIVALLVGFGLVGMVVRAWSKRPPSAPSSGASVSSPEFDQFREQARQETDV